MSDWKETKLLSGESHLSKTFVFADFSEAFAFVTRVALLAEQQNHHPWWSNNWNTVEFRLFTHSEGNIITKKDRVLASSIDKLIKP